MAKKKSKSADINKKESMVSKVEIKEPGDQEKLSRVVGGIFIVLGIALISYGIYSFIRFNRSPELDESFDAPSLSGTETLTNQEEILIRGIAEEYDQVFVYVDNDEVGRVRVSDDFTFEYSHLVEMEGTYVVSVAGVRGFPKRYMSVQSDMRLVEVDWTAPELADIKFPVEVGTKTFTLLGEVEPNCSVILRRGTDRYEGNCDEEGSFRLEGVSLDDGPNVFTLEISDEAGNSVEVEERIRVIYSMDSDIDGNAVFDELPVASGEFEAAMRIVRENNLMVIFGIIALIAMLSSTVYTLSLKKKV